MVEVTSIFFSLARSLLRPRRSLNNYDRITLARLSYGDKLARDEQLENAFAKLRIQKKKPRSLEEPFSGLTAADFVVRDSDRESVPFRIKRKGKRVRDKTERERERGG